MTDPSSQSIDETTPSDFHHPGRTLASSIVPLDDGTEQCVLTPRDSATDLQTEWITADGDSFVALDDVR